MKIVVIKSFPNLTGTVTLTRLGESVILDSSSGSVISTLGRALDTLQSAYPYDESSMSVNSAHGWYPIADDVTVEFSDQSDGMVIEFPSLDRVDLTQVVYLNWDYDPMNLGFAYSNVAGAFVFKGVDDVIDTVAEPPVPKCLGESMGEIVPLSAMTTAAYRTALQALFGSNLVVYEDYGFAIATFSVGANVDGHDVGIYPMVAGALPANVKAPFSAVMGYSGVGDLAYVHSPNECVFRSQVIPFGARADAAGTSGSSSMTPAQAAAVGTLSGMFLAKVLLP